MTIIYVLMGIFEFIFTEMVIEFHMAFFQLTELIDTRATKKEHFRKKRFKNLLRTIRWMKLILFIYTEQKF